MERPMAVLIENLKLVVATHRDDTNLRKLYLDDVTHPSLEYIDETNSIQSGFQKKSSLIYHCTSPHCISDALVVLSVPTKSISSLILVA